MKYLLIFFISLFYSQEIVSISPSFGFSGQQNLAIELIAEDIDFYDFYTEIDDIYFSTDDIDIESYSISGSQSISMVVNINNQVNDGSVFDITMTGFDGYSWENFQDTKYNAFTVYNVNPIIDIDIDYISNDLFSQSSSQTYTGNGAITYHNFNVSEFATSAPQINIEIFGDYDAEPEYVEIFYENLLIGTLADFYDEYGNNQQSWSEQYNINLDNFNDMLDDGFGDDFNEEIEIRIENSNAVDEIDGNFHNVDFEYTKIPGFGKVTIGDSASLPILLSNLGSQDLIVDNIFIANNDFYISENSFSISPGETKEIYLTFNPMGYGYSYLNMLISSNDPYNPYLDFEFSGYSIENDNLLGDLNNDGGLNVSDIIILINLILNDQYDILGDINQDASLNIADCILLINLILNN
tara:strand:- start:435 stop:1667 length:1233 start_codon:yes stop_codon:yes gene_type:complete